MTRTTNVAVLCDVSSGVVTLSFAEGRLRLTPDSARVLAARLLLLAEQATDRVTIGMCDGDCGRAMPLDANMCPACVEGI